MKSGGFVLVRIVLAAVVCCLFGTFAVAQNQPLVAGGQADVATTEEGQSAEEEELPPMGSYLRETIVQKLEPIPYPHVREADVLWSKIIWRTIDLRQKMNFPLYYPTVDMRDRKSLAQALYYAIQNKEIHAYSAEVEPGDELVKKLTPEEITKLMGGQDRIIEQTDMETGEIIQLTVKGSIKWEEILQFWLKEEWFFDSKRSMLDVRVIAICPVMRQEVERAGEKIVSNVPLFWVYYPESRKVLAKTTYFNPQNDAQEISFDDLFFKRRFGSYILRESNPYNNRRIADYKVGGVATQMESDKIYYDIFNKEHDLWEF